MTKHSHEPVVTPLSPAGHSAVETLWHGLEPHLHYLSAQARAQVRAALEFAYMAHEGQKRKSGEPYIIHPVAVAQILAE
ncbi:MAG: hypothetical protein N2318_01930, partial [Meiothermus sp.]|nr:hypothetical protein [Meiothermus sp.]